MAELLICVLSMEGVSVLPSTLNCCPHKCGLDQSFLYCKLMRYGVHLLPSKRTLSGSINVALSLHASLFKAELPVMETHPS